MSDRMPTLFLGHGSPENAIADNAYTRRLAALADELPRPEAILMVSAHYMTEGSALTSAEHPRTIHDFYGFPEELFEVEYPAPGAPHLAADVAGLVGGSPDGRWGLDHGAWSPMRHIWPKADVPTVELSIDLSMPAKRHYELGRALSGLRDQGVLVVASGNVVHNLGRIQWGDPEGGADWAHRFDDAAREIMLADPSSIGSLIDHPDYAAAVPTPDHFLPLAYVAGLSAASGQPARTLIDGYAYGSLSMTCYVVGA